MTVDNCYSHDSSTPVMLGVLMTGLFLLLSASPAAFSYLGDFLSEPYGSKTTSYGAHLLADIGATKAQMSPQTKTRPRQLSTCFGVHPLERTGHPLSPLGHLSTVVQKIGSFFSNLLPSDRAPPASSLT
jgi:hypothetical protein